MSDPLQLTLAEAPHSKRVIEAVVADNPKMGRVDITLMESVEWLCQHGAVEGGKLFLDLPEFRFRGEARVVRIRPCLPLTEGEGRPVTGWFKQAQGNRCQVRLGGHEETIGITWSHPIWSLDRMAWVPAGELRKGERVQGKGGPLIVESFTKREKEEPVYNIEVDGDHCYRVGECGLLVHNASAGDPKVVQIETAHPGIKVDLPATVGDVFRAVDCARPNDFFIRAELMPRGVLTFSVVTVRTASDRSTIRATEFFAAAMEWFGAGSVQEIHLRWIEVGAAPGGLMLDTNFQVFLTNFDPTTDNRDAAARTTPSYRIVSASPWSFSTIEIVTLDPSDPRQFARRRSGRQVNVICKRGGIAVPTTPPIQQPPPASGQGSNPGQQPPPAAG
jgi:hypothetical protein